MGVAEGIDSEKLSEAGWGIIFHNSETQAVREALSPLLALREQQAGQYYREFWGVDGYQPGNSKNDFLKRFGKGPGTADPAAGVPYYLLIVGGPEKIPFTFQYQLDVQYAVGRICFDTPEEYACYAQRIVDAESVVFSPQRKMSIFAPFHADDVFTEVAREYLISPLHQSLRKKTDIQLSVSLGKDATKTVLINLLEDASILLISAHGIAFPPDFPLQRMEQGAILCADWPGPALHQGPIPRDFYFSGLDCSENSNFRSKIVIANSSYSVGTPERDIFLLSGGGMVGGSVTGSMPASEPFISYLSKKLLGQQNGNTLAFIGMSDRVWSFSYPSKGFLVDGLAFDSVLNFLLNGSRVGRAAEYFNERYAEVSTMLTEVLDNFSFDKNFDETIISSLWASNNDARNTTILGDPAVRV